MIYNLTQHAATPLQVAGGVTDLEPRLRAKLQTLLTFGSPPDATEMRRRASDIAGLAWEAGAMKEILAGEDVTAMIGGAPYFMAPLELGLAKSGILPVYAFSRRLSVDVPQPDGSVLKQGAFHHVPGPDGALPWVTANVGDLVELSRAKLIGGWREMYPE